MPEKPRQIMSSCFPPRFNVRAQERKHRRCARMRALLTAAFLAELNIVNREPLSAADIDRILQMAWEDRTAFDAIRAQFSIGEAQVIQLMRAHLKRSSFVMWRKRVSGRKTKHQAMRSSEVTRFKSSDQKGD